MCMFGETALTVEGEEIWLYKFDITSIDERKIPEELNRERNFLEVGAGRLKSENPVERESPILGRKEVRKMAGEEWKVQNYK